MEAKKAVRDYLLLLSEAGQPKAKIDYEAAMQRAIEAHEFVSHPYWARLARMLSGTIQAETEEMLESDKNLAINRASVAMCRKVLQMPFYDIEQGKMANKFYEQAKARLERHPNPARPEAGRVA